MLIDTRKAGTFTIKTYALPEYQSPRDCYDNSLIDEVMAGIESGRLEWFAVKVSAEWEGLELASDYLGGCCYESFEQFANGQDYHADMIREVISQSYARLQALCDAGIRVLEEVAA